VAEALASADLFVFPSETDSAGNVVLEAQAAGLPVIVMEKGGPKEYIRNGVTGLVCVTHRDLLARTAALVSDEALRRVMGRAAREHARGLRWEHALQPLYAGYRALVGSNIRHRTDVPAAGSGAIGRRAS
jgi:glycosyltransferase involved in cell wall biosynthesis